jgi:glyoxylase-like metal-dependent hydrolase (beta-lactamase superfamily II)/8-oxo-dGTP pyrophosphatase MutT (NUDIX family)
MPASAVTYRESAAVALMRGAGAALEVFWVRRSDLVSYMPGFDALVGGKVAPEDLQLKISGCAEEPDRVLRSCAIREAFEEAGVLAGLAVESPVDAARLAEARRRLLAGEARFDVLAIEHGWRFNGAALHAAGRWQTPPFATQKFDTQFYLTRIPQGQEASIRSGELASGEWVRPADALARWREGAATFAAPILWVLKVLEQGARLGATDPQMAEELTRAPDFSARPVRRIELKWGIVLHPMRTKPLPPATHTNAYLVGEGEMALIDPGSGEKDELRELFALIEALERDGRKLTTVLLTHEHPDHRGGVAEVCKRWRVKVASHELTARQVAADIKLADGDWVRLAGTRDWSLRAIHTPGHARGHLCFLHPRTQSLFTGDHIPGGTGTVIIDPPDGDMADYLNSLRRLSGEPIQTLFPGHGSPQGGAIRRIQGLIDHRMAREQKVLAALGSEPQKLAALVTRAYADTPREMWPYAERSLLAHLLKLEREGRAKRSRMRQDELWASA